MNLASRSRLSGASCLVLLSAVAVLAHAPALREVIPGGKAAEIEAAIAKVSAALPADEARMFKHSLMWLEESFAETTGGKSRHQQLLDWLQGNTPLYTIYWGYARYHQRTQNTIDDLFNRRMAAMNKSNDKSLIMAQREAWLKEGERIKKELDVFVADRDQASEDWKAFTALTPEQDGELTTPGDGE